MDEGREKETKCFVEFTYPGSFVSETSSREIPSRDAIALPERADGYRTFVRSETVVDGETLKGAPRDYSPMTYVGRAYTLDEVKASMPHERILIANMEGNGYARVVRARSGRFYELHEGDRVIPMSDLKIALLDAPEPSHVV